MLEKGHRRRNGTVCGVRASIARDHPGFTLLELVIVVAIVGILASAILPLSHWSVKRTREIELQRGLRELRSAVDAYHDAAVQGLIETEAGEPGYPPDLETLVEGVEILDRFRDPDDKSRRPRRVKFLRRIPIDPMTGEAEWGLRCYEDDPDDRFWCRKDVYDVYSLSRWEAIDGTMYRDW